MTDTFHQPDDQVRTVPLDEIVRDDQRRTRGRDEHLVADLVQSILAFGLIEPLVVDEHSGLVAGWNRTDAIDVIRDQHPDRFGAIFPSGRIPVRFVVLGENPERRALQVAEAENRHRHRFTDDELDTLRRRFEKMDGISSCRGRPKKGEVSMTEALSQATGMSKDAVRKQAQRQRKKAGGGQKSQVQQQGAAAADEQTVGTVSTVPADGAEHVRPQPETGDMSPFSPAARDALTAIFDAIATFRGETKQQPRAEQVTALRRELKRLLPQIAALRETMQRGEIAGTDRPGVDDASEQESDGDAA